VWVGVAEGGQRFGAAALAQADVAAPLLSLERLGDRGCRYVSEVTCGNYDVRTDIE
jgi:hypothetical protein